MKIKLAYKIAIAISTYVIRPFVIRMPLCILLSAARILAVPLTPLNPIAWRLLAAGLIRSVFRLLSVGYLHSAGSLEKQIIRYKTFHIKDVPGMVNTLGEEHLHGAMGSGRGVILVTVHSPVFRLLQLWLKQTSYQPRPYLIKRMQDMSGNDLKSRRLTLIHHQQLRIFDGRLIDVGMGLRRAVRVLRDGGTLLICQDEAQPGAESVNYFGRPAKTPLGAARLAEMNDALILPLVMVPIYRPRRWLLRFWPAIDPRHGPVKPRLAEALEAIFSSYPQAWEWRSLRMLGH